MAPMLKISLAAATMLAGAGLAAQAHELTASPVMTEGGFRPSPAHARVFASPEAAFVPEGWDMAIVSNQDGDAPGFLSLLNPDGSVENLHWVDDERFLNPTGLRSYGDMLYVANGVQIVAVDMEAAAVTDVYDCEGAQFVNDIATGPDGTVYGSESFGGGIFRVSPGSDTCEWFVEGGDPNLQTINGLLGTEDALIAVTIPGRVVSVDYETGETTLLGEGVGSLDGVEPAPGGEGFLLSDTNGKILHFHDGETQVLIDSSSAGIGANDMAFDTDLGVAYLARAGWDTISLYKIEIAE